MRRPGWAFCLGLFLAGTAAAQPPADEDRFPPAPDLPGQVVAQHSEAMASQTSAPKGANPAALPEFQSAPTADKGSAVPALGMFPPPAPCPPAAPAARKGCSIGFGDIQEWLLFRSRARQSGCYPPAYYPPLYTWFPCEPGKGPCCVGGTPGKPMCLPGAPVAPAMVTPNSTSVTLGVLPVPEKNAAPESQLGGGAAIGRC